MGYCHTSRGAPTARWQSTSLRAAASVWCCCSGRPPGEEWWYPALADGVTHVPFGPDVAWPEAQIDGFDLRPAIQRR